MTNKYDCPKCGSKETGDLDCHICMASGDIVDLDGNEIECKDCDGMGYVDGTMECLDCSHEFDTPS